jgi:maleylacetate reductase
VRDFVHELVTGRVVFGAGSIAQVADEVRRLGCSRVLIIGGRHARVYADSITKDLGQLAAGRIEEVVQHVPLALADAAIALSDRLRADLLVPVGGGSSIGLAKAIARERSVAILAVPTTYAGSEMSPIWGLTEADRKSTGRAARVQPRVVVYDPNTTLSMPPHLTAVSGMNALAHAAEALYAPQVSPLVLLAAEQSVRLFARALPVLAADPQDCAARSDALYAAFLAGVSLGNAAMGIHHKICHVLGGAYNLPHGDIHSAVLPYAVAFNRDDAPEAMSRIAAALDHDDAAAGIWQVAHNIGAPTDLISTGFSADQIEAVADVVANAEFPNPRTVSIEGVCDLLGAACAGSQPQR